MEFKKLGIPRQIVLDILEKHLEFGLAESKDNYMYYKNKGDWEGVDLMENNINLYEEYLKQIKKERSLI